MPELWWEVDQQIACAHPHTFLRYAHLTNHNPVCLGKNSILYSSRKWVDVYYGTHLVNKPQKVCLQTVFFFCEWLLYFALVHTNMHKTKSELIKTMVFYLNQFRYGNIYGLELGKTVTVQKIQAVDSKSGKNRKIDFFKPLIFFPYFLATYYILPFL